MGKHDDLKQFSEFPVPTYEEWRSVTEKSLRGKSFDTLLTRLMDDIVLEPMYQEKDLQNNVIKADEPGKFPYTRGISSGVESWKISQELTAPTPEQLNEIIKHDLDRGQNVYHLLLDEGVKKGESPLVEEGAVGVPIYDRTDVESIFSGLDVTAFPLHIDAGEVSSPLLAALHSLAKGKKLSGIVAADPVHQLAKNGELSYPLEQTLDQLATVVKWAQKEAPQLRTVLVQTYAYHNGGASPAVELAAALSTGVTYVRALIDRGLTADDAGKAISFAFSVGTEYFTELAKLRVARTLWAAIMKEFGASEEAQKMIIHARTSAFTKTVGDIYVNMLRGTSEAFAAAAAGANSLHVSPFDEAVQEATSFSRRIARNTSLILQEESHIDKTIDPAGGSWYVEHLTDELAQKAWTKFQQIEKEGGMIQALENGQVQAWIDQAWEGRAREVERRKRVVVGVNQYVNLEESFTSSQKEENNQARAHYVKNLEKKQVDVQAKVSTPETFAQIVQLVEQNVPLSFIHKQLGAGAGETLTVTPIPERRLAEPFESLRARTEAIEAASGQKPTVYLLGLGTLADYKARADFITGFFQSGGFAVKVGDGEAGLKEAASYQLVVLCGKDNDYTDQAENLVKAVKAQNDTGKCFIAGQQSDEFTAKLKQAGLDDCIHVKTNVYTFLNDVQQWMKGGSKHE